MDKYYIPKIEEFYVGFIYERLQFVNQWCPMEYSGDWDELTLETLIARGKVRVKCLDREDIESLEFTFKTEDNKTDLFINFKLNVSIIYNFETKVLRMITMDLAKSELYHEIQTDPHRIGGIIIKNKSEFKKLITQLNLL